jgi:hypothetical protein
MAPYFPELQRKQPTGEISHLSLNPEFACTERDSMITAAKIDDSTFRVTIKGHTITEHEVTVDRPYYVKLTDGQVTREILLEKSFEFLLERESNTSILRRFDLPVIGRYFPEYEKTIRNMIK